MGPPQRSEIGPLQGAISEHDLWLRRPPERGETKLSNWVSSGIILKHGGVPSLAHPGFLEDPTLAERILDATPIRAIEVFHRYRSATRHLRYLDLARRRNLRITGGSDYHGDEHPNNGSLGAFTCPPVHWKEFEYGLRGL